MDDSRIHIGDLKSGHVALLKDVAEQAAELAVKKTFLNMGMDPNDPIKAQRDFAYLRTAREGSESIWGKVVLTLVGLITITLTSWISVGVQTFMSGGSPKGPHP